MQKYRMWCDTTHGHQMDKANAEGFGYYIASDVDAEERKQVARIAELEHELDIRKAAVDTQFRLMERVKELEQALQFYATATTVHVWDKKGAYHQKGANVARKALGL